MWGLSRAVFDAMLLDAARAAGAVVRQPARCEDIARSASGVHVRVRDTVSNRVDLLGPTFVLLADGKGAALGAAPPPTGDFGIKAHLVNVDGPRDAIELFATGGRYGGLAAVEGGRWNAAFSVSSDQLRSIVSDVPAMFDHLVAQNRALARRLRRAERVGDWLAAPLPRFGASFDKSLPPNVIPLGNAAAAVEPIGGEGMGLALRSGELVAEALAARGGAWTDDDQRRLAHDYGRLWRTRRFACRAAALAVTSRWFAPLAGAAGFQPPGLRVALGLMGK
jgi:flavin-dependent dehydrogenase